MKTVVVYNDEDLEVLRIQVVSEEDAEELVDFVEGFGYSTEVLEG